MANYDQLVLDSKGTVHNTAANVSYSNPDQLAMDLGVSKDQIQWGNIRRDNNFTPAPAITSAQLAPSQQANVPTQSPSASQPNSAVAGSQQAANSYQNYLTTYGSQQTPEQQQASQLTQDVMKLFGETAGQKQALLEAENQLGLPQMNQEVAALNSDLLRQVQEYQVSKTEYDNLIAAAEDKTRSLGKIRGEQGRLARAQIQELNLKASEAKLTEARIAGKMGQIEQAQAAAKRAVDLRYAGKIEELEIKTKQLSALQASGILSQQEQLQAEARQAAYQQDQQKLEAEKTKAKENVSLAFSANVATSFVNRGGEFFRATDGKPYTSPQEFFHDAGVKSFEEAYQKGLITDLSGNRLADLDFVSQLRAKYPDAGIQLSDPVSVATQKLNNSRLYREQVRPPVSSSGVPQGPGGQLYAGLSSSTATAVRGQVSAFKSEPIVQNFATIQEGYNFAQSLSNTTTNPADDQALIYSLAKALDPGSVVREGEYATAQKYAQSWIKAYGKGVEQAVNGTGFLSETARKNIKQTIASKYGASKASYDNLYQQYVGGINNLTGRADGSAFMRDYSIAQPNSIRVKEKSSGQTGTIPESEFDPNLYERI